MKRRKLVTMGVSFLLCVGMVGAGFASWLITGSTTEDFNSTIKVESVFDQRLNLKLATANDDENWDGESGELWDADLYFGRPAKINDVIWNEESDTTNNNGKWLQNIDGEVEDLTLNLGLTLSYSNLKTLLSTGMKTITLTFGLTNAYAYSTEFKSALKGEGTTNSESKNVSYINAPKNLSFSDTYLDSNFDEQEFKRKSMLKYTDETESDTNPADVSYQEFNYGWVVDEESNEYVLSQLVGKISVSDTNEVFTLQFNIANLVAKAEEYADSIYTNANKTEDAENNITKEMIEKDQAAKQNLLNSYEFKYMIAFEYTWGDVFKTTVGDDEKYENPFIFFNSKRSDVSSGYKKDDKDLTWADFAVHLLQTLEAVNNDSKGLTISVKGEVSNDEWTTAA